MIFTFQLPDISFPLDPSIDFVNLSVAVNGTQIYCEKSYNRGLSAGLDSLSSLVEDYMTLHDLVLASVQVSATRGANNQVVVFTRSFSVCFCHSWSLNCDPEFFLTENFLLTNHSPRIAPKQDFSCRFVAFDAEDVSVTVSCVLKNSADPADMFIDSFRLDVGHIQQDDAVRSVALRHGDFISLLADHQGYEIVEFSVVVGNRSVTVSVDPQLVTGRDCYRFRNAFNVWEDLTIPASTTRKPDISSSLAAVNGNNVPYDLQNNVTFEVETAGLTLLEFAAVEQLCSSQQVEKYIFVCCSEDPDIYTAQIVVTDTDLQCRHDAEEPPTAKFSWRYRSMRPDFSPVVSKSVYTHQFNINFN